MKKFLEFITTHWDVIAPCVYEIIVRIIPTKKNLSLIDNGWKILNFVITNKRKPAATDVYDWNSETKNKIAVDRNKHILHCIIFVFASLTVTAQNPNNQFKATYYNTPAADTAFVKNTRLSLQNLNGPTAGIMFNETQNKWRVWNPDIDDWSDWNITGSGATGAFWPLSGSANKTAPVTIGGNFSVSLDGEHTFNTFIRPLSASGVVPTLEGQIGYDANFNIYRMNLNGTTGLFNWTQSSITNQIPFYGGLAGQLTGNTNITYDPTATHLVLTTTSAPTISGSIAYNTSSGIWSVRSGTNNLGLPVLASADFVANRIPYFANATGRANTDAGFEYDPGTDRLISSNATFATDLRATYLGTNGVLFDNGTSIATENLDFFYDSPTNSLQIRNTTATHTGSYFGGTIQLQESSTLDRLTIEAATLDNTSKIFTTSGENLTITATGTGILNLNGQFVNVNGSALQLTSDGTYVPGATSIANIGIISVGPHFYHRIGNTWTVTGQLTITCNAGAGTASSLSLSLPSTPNFTTANEGRGLAGNSSTNNVGGFVSGTGGNNNRVILSFNSNSTTADTWNYTFMYTE